MTTSSRSRDAAWLLGAIALVVIAALALRYGTNILSHDAMFDEIFIRVPIDNLIEHGWSMEGAIDFEETKGPALIWPYAIIGNFLGGSLNDLRLISVMFFISGIVPLLLIARRCGLRGPALLIIAGLYLLLPYNALLGQMLMSEASFIFGSLVLICVFLWGFGRNELNASRTVLGPGAGSDTLRRAAAPILFGVLLAILLHNRIHAVAYAAAVCLIAYERDRIRSWPWCAACALAGLSRAPLSIRWGGLVSAEYQDRYGLGFAPEAMTYCAAALVPLTGAFLWPALAAHGRRLAPIMIGAITGLMLGIMASPDLGRDPATGARFFAGITASFMHPLPGGATGLLAHTLLAILAMIGLASLGAMAALAWDRAARAQQGWGQTVLCAQLTVLTLAAGWALFGLTKGAVFDRYLLPWGILIPILWLRWLPRWLLLVQAIVILAIAAYQINTWLIEGGPHAAG